MFLGQLGLETSCDLLAVRYIVPLTHLNKGFVYLMTVQYIFYLFISRLTVSQSSGLHVFMLMTIRALRGFNYSQLALVCH